MKCPRTFCNIKGVFRFRLTLQHLVNITCKLFAMATLSVKSLILVALLALFASSRASPTPPGMIHRFDEICARACAQFLNPTPAPTPAPSTSAKPTIPNLNSGAIKPAVMPPYKKCYLDCMNDFLDVGN